MNKPRISGFTFIKNGLTLGYPILESIQSIQSLCDEVIINVGFDRPELTQDDGTYEYLRDHLPQSKYIFLKNYWDPEVQKGGLILSQQTNLALTKCRGSFCQYIQGDEVIHENDLPLIEQGVQEMEKRKEIEGLAFNYLHFHGNVDVIKHTRNIYRREVRLIRHESDIVSHGDAQGFRHRSGEKIKAMKTSARIFHYGWARAEKVMEKKIKVMDKLYHGKNFEAQDFQYKRIWGLQKFSDSHPLVMKEWIEKNKNPLDIMSLKLDLHWADLGLMLSDAIEKFTGYRPGEFRNFKSL